MKDKKSIHETNESADETESNQDEKRPGLFNDLSISQVVAGALAAVTSVALSSQIGIAGSIIGVAVASIVSTVASQLYRAMLTRSADKLRKIREQSDLTIPNPLSSQFSRTTSDTDKTSTQNADLTQPMAHATKSSEDTSATPGTGSSPASDKDAAHLRMAPASLREEAATRRQTKLRRRVTVAAIVASLIAVAVTAAIINFATNGEGIGTKVGADPAPATPIAQTPAQTKKPATESHTPKAQSSHATTQPESHEAETQSSQSPVSPEQPVPASPAAQQPTSPSTPANTPAAANEQPKSPVSPNTPAAETTKEQPISKE